MQEPLVAKRRVDLDTWERRSVFEFFRNFTEPYHGVCVRVDCTETYRYAKANNLSVFLSLVHRSLTAAGRVENFRTRIVDGVVWRYETLNGGSAVGRPNGTIGFGYYLYRADIVEFAKKAAIEVERVRGRDDLERPEESNLIRYSSLPWFDFTSISHARDLSTEDSAPRVTFGKFSEQDGRRTMPVSIHVHHGLADGLHVAQFLDHFQKLLGAPDSNELCSAL